MTKLDELQKAIEEAAETSLEMLRKSQMAFDFTAPNPHAHDHHVAYTRTNASGTVSNIAAKGAPTVHPLQAEADVSNKPGADSHTAAKMLQRVADKHRNNMYRKADSFKDTHGNYELPASAVAGNEAREYKTTDVYGNNSQRHQGQLVPGESEFSPEFQKIQEEHGHNSFILNHNGHRYLVDPQGYSYARYITHIKGEPKGTVRIEKNPNPTGVETFKNDGDNAIENNVTIHRHGDAYEKHMKLIDGVHKVGNDLLNNPMMAAHHDNIRRKLEGLKTNPTAKYAAQVAGDLKLMAEKAKPTAKPIKVDVDTSSHFRSHLKEPKGRGGWMFSKHPDVDFGIHKQGEDWISTPSMTYGEAKKHAKEWAASKGHSRIYVMP